MTGRTTEKLRRAGSANDPGVLRDGDLGEREQAVDGFPNDDWRHAIEVEVLIKEALADRKSPLGRADTNLADTEGLSTTMKDAMVFSAAFALWSS